jgi:hypothetical protein
MERNGPGESPPLPRRRGRFVWLESRVGIRGPALNDEEHIIPYQRLLDAHAEGADWRGRSTAICRAQCSVVLLKRVRDTVHFASDRDFGSIDTVFLRRRISLRSSCKVLI